MTVVTVHFVGGMFETFYVNEQEFEENIVDFIDRKLGMNQPFRFDVNKCVKVINPKNVTYIEVVGVEIDE